MRDLYAPFMSWGPSCSFPNCTTLSCGSRVLRPGGDNTPERNSGNIVTPKVWYSANWRGFPGVSFVHDNIGFTPSRKATTKKREKPISRVNQKLSSPGARRQLT